jgi:23S rRNA (guanosine2251-2'-O)-methyltransferase
LRRNKQNNNFAALKNYINKGQYLIGKSAILEIFDDEFRNFESIILPSSFKSAKIKQILLKANKYKIPVIDDSKLVDRFEQLGNFDSSGVIVLLKKQIEKYYSLSEILDIGKDVDSMTVLAFSDMDYEQNVGAILRTCAGLGVDFVLISNGQQKVFSPTVTKVSMGYNYAVPIVKENFLLAIKQLKENGFEIMGLDMGGENVMDMRYNSRVCFIVGHESKGITETIKSRCDKILSIPMANGVESLNASVSVGMILYDRCKKNYEIKR